MSFAEGESGPWLGDLNRAGFGLRFVIQIIRMYRCLNQYLRARVRSEWFA